MFMLSTAVTEPEAVTRLEKILDKLFEKLSALGSNLLTGSFSCNYRLVYHQIYC